MLTLAVETSAERCGIALVDPQGVRGIDEFGHEMRLLTELAPRVQHILDTAGVGLPDVDVFAVDIGPGSFTGIRTGIMTAKTLAWATGRPLVGVESLAAVAATGADRPSGVVVSLIRARPGFAYWQAFNGDPTLRITEPALVATADIGSALRAVGVSACTVCVPSRGAWSETALGSMASAGIDAEPRYMEAPSVLAVCNLASLRGADTPEQDPLRVAPLYVADPLIGPPAART